MIGAGVRRPGVALGTLLGIVAVTAGWWALALWPSGAATPEWLERTRAACFGSPPGGLPDAGGWVLLIGQPIGMVAVLLAVWGDALRADIARWRARPTGRSVLLAVPLLVLVGVVSAAGRVAAVRRAGAPPAVEPTGTLSVGTISLDGLALTDQVGRTRALREVASRVALLTVAFGHCETVCPTVVRDLLRVREATGRSDVPLVVVTVDPWRDTPNRLSSLADGWGLGPHDLVLSGTVAAVEQALDRLGIARSRDTRTGDVVHTTAVFRLDRGAVVARLDGGWGRAPELLGAQ